MTDLPPQKPRVVVVGSGLAGLGAAWTLARRGFDVSVLEARDAPGGRTRGRTQQGYAVENGLHVLAASDRRLLDWIGELGLESELLPARRVQLAQVYDGAVAPIDPERWSGRARMRGVRWLDALRTTRLARLMARYRTRGGLDREAPERSARWDDRSVADFARLYFGASAFEAWMAPALCSVHPCDEYETSRVAFLLLHAAGLENARAHAVLRRPLAHLVEAACARLDVRLGTRLDRIEAAGDGAPALALALAGGEVLEADAVVLATSVDEVTRIASPLLTRAERDFLRDVSYAPTITMTLGLEGPLMGEHRFVRVPRAERSPIESYVLDPTGEGRAPRGSAYAVVASTERFALAHAGADEDVVRKSLCEALGRFHKGIERRVRFAHVARASHGVPHFQVGAYRSLARFAAIQEDRRAQGRRLYFAGDYLCGPRAENALASGLRAAEAVAEDLA